ncbi:MAG: helix-turn-helix domain-containing protein [Nanoarchaeota archaeon]|nr:helix-turn-helix domain-containing protein [Nanoarchaeota archaeon]
MWVLKFKGVHPECVLSLKVVKSNVILHFLPLGFFKIKNNIYFSASSFLEGIDKDKKKFIRLMKEDKKVVKIEIVGNLIFTLIKESTRKGFYDSFYNPAIFCIKPVILKPDGYEYWEIASWERKFLENIFEILHNKKTCSDYKIFKFKQEKLDDFIFPKLIPRLSKRQKESIEFAYNEGYYEIPKKVTLEKLSKEIGISKQTFQKHLSSAEKKILPFLLE